MENKRTNTYRIHLAASTLIPLTLLVSVSYMAMYRTIGTLGRWMVPPLVILCFLAGYWLMRLEERIFGLTRTDHDIDDGFSEVARRYVYKRYLIAPALLSLIPAAAAVPLVDLLIRHLVDTGGIDYYSENYLAPWLVAGFIVLSTVWGAVSRMQPGNITLNGTSIKFYVILHMALFIIAMFMEVPSILPCLMLTVVMIVALFELNASFVEDITHKTGDTASLTRLLDTNFRYVRRIVGNFWKVYIVPFLLTAAVALVWQYLLENALNQPL